MWLVLFNIGIRHSPSLLSVSHVLASWCNPFSKIGIRHSTRPVKVAIVYPSWCDLFCPTSVSFIPISLSGLSMNSFYNPTCSGQQWYPSFPYIVEVANVPMFCRVSMRPCSCQHLHQSITLLCFDCQRLPFMVRLFNGQHWIPSSLCLFWVANVLLLWCISVLDNA